MAVKCDIALWHTYYAKFGGSPQRDQRLALLDPVEKSSDALSSVLAEAAFGDAAEPVVVQAAAISTSN